MQGRKDFTPKLFYELSLDGLVPREDFYRKVNEYLDLHFLYKATEKYYGSEGQQSIDPVVFFKILLVGYLNNINSDRALLRYCSDSLSVRLFLGYDLNEELPWHSTISRTHQLLGEEVFLGLFQKVLQMSTAGSKDSSIFSEIMEQTIRNLKQNDMEVDQVLADAGYSSGESLQYCQDHQIDAYIPNFGQYKPEREGFVLNEAQNRYECKKEGGNHAVLPFKRILTDSKGYQKKSYRSSEKDCGNC